MIFDHKINYDILREHKIELVLGKIDNYLQKWIQNISRTAKLRLTQAVMKYQPARKRNPERPPKDFQIVT